MPHADVVGSLIRPPELLAAREDLAAGRIAPAEFKRAEDAAVDNAVAAQEEAGLDILTDGEMRRLSFQSQMPEAVEGFGEFDIDAFLWGDWRGGERVGDLRQQSTRARGVLLDRYRLLAHDVSENKCVPKSLRQELVDWLEPRVEWILDR